MAPFSVLSKPFACWSNLDSFATSEFVLPSMATICLHQSSFIFHPTERRKQKDILRRDVFIETGPCFCFGDTLEHLVSCRSETELRLILTLIKGELCWKMTIRPSFIHLHVRPNPKAVVVLVGLEKKKCRKISWVLFEVIWDVWCQTPKWLKVVWMICAVLRVFWSLTMRLKSFHCPSSEIPLSVFKRELWGDLRAVLFVNCRNDIQYMLQIFGIIIGSWV